jgi:hypothetical protein
MEKCGGLLHYYFGCMDDINDSSSIIQFEIKLIYDMEDQSFTIDNTIQFPQLKSIERLKE